MANNNGITGVDKRLQEQYAILQAYLGGAQTPDRNVAQEVAYLKSILGTPDYAKQEAQALKDAQIDALLAAATAGFTYAGAPRAEGEGELSVFGRSFGAPLAESLRQRAAAYSQEKRATDLAAAKQERELKLSALGRVEDRATTAAALERELREAALKGEVGDAEKLEDMEVQDPETGEWRRVGTLFRKTSGVLGDKVVITDAQGLPVEGRIRKYTKPETGYKPDATLKEVILKLNGEKVRGLAWFNQPYKSDGTPGTPFITTSDGGQVLKLGENVWLPETDESKDTSFAPTSSRTVTLNEGATNILQGLDLFLTASPGSLDGRRSSIQVTRPKGENQLGDTILTIGGNSINLTEEIAKKNLTQAQAASLYTLTDTKAGTEIGLANPADVEVMEGLVVGLDNYARTQSREGRSALMYVPSPVGEGDPNNQLDPTAKNFPLKIRDANSPLGWREPSPEEKKRISNVLWSRKASMEENIKAGDSALDLEQMFARSVLNLGPNVFGLEQAETTTSAGMAQQRNMMEMIRNNPGVSPNVYLEEVFYPGNSKEFNTGAGKLLVVSGEAPWLFRSDTVNPVEVPTDLTEAAERRELVNNLDWRSVQARANVETSLLNRNLTKGMSLDKLPDENVDLFSEAVANSDLVKAQTDAADRRTNEKVVKHIETSLSLLHALDEYSALATKSGVEGFGFGALRKAWFGVTGDTGLDVFRTEEGADASAKLMGVISTLQFLGGRELLKATGEQRLANQDMEQVLKILPEINRSEDLNAERINALRKHLRNSLRANLGYYGTYTLRDEAIESAIQLGVDVSNIKPMNNLVNPFFDNGNYRITGLRIPSYSAETHNLIQAEGLLKHAPTKVSGGNTFYKVMEYDENGKALDTHIYLTKEFLLRPSSRAVLNRYLGDIRRVLRMP
jgi:hypothetical protein